MTELATIMEGFFRSECTSIKEYKEKLLESKSRSMYEEAVDIYRQGTKKLRINDFTGLDDIKKANEILKIVAGNYSNSDVTLKMQHLSESISTFDINNLEEESEMLQYQFETLKDRLEEAGLTDLPPVVDQNADLNNVNGEVTPNNDATTTIPDAKPINNDDESVGIKNGDEIMKFVKEEGESSFKDEGTENPDVNLSTGSSSGMDNPPEDIAPSSTSTRSGDIKNAYEEGFQEGRKMWESGRKSKEIISDLIEKELKTHSYAYVKAFEEGFHAGNSHEQIVREARGEIKGPSDK